MKAITLHQPWAMLIATGWKEVETRDWYTSYRGPLAIHAGKRWTVEEGDDYDMILTQLNNLKLDHKNLIGIGGNNSGALGCIVATCNLVACMMIADNGTKLLSARAKSFKPAFEPKHGWNVEQIMGNYEAGRWAWILRDVVPVDPPIPARGYQKLWKWRRPS